MSVQSFSFSSKSVIIPSYNSQPVLDLDNNNNTARPTSSDLKINKNIWNKFKPFKVVVVAQVVEQSLLTEEIYGLNPFNGICYLLHVCV